MLVRMTLEQDQVHYLHLSVISSEEYGNEAEPGQVQVSNVCVNALGDVFMISTKSNKQITQHKKKIAFS